MLPSRVNLETEKTKHERFRGNIFYLRHIAQQEEHYVIGLSSKGLNSKKHVG